MKNIQVLLLLAAVPGFGCESWFYHEEHCDGECCEGDGAGCYYSDPLLSIEDYMAARPVAATYFYEFSWIDPDDTTGLMVAELSTFDANTREDCLRFVVHDPARSGLAVGDQVCHVCGNTTFSEVPGFSPLDRQATSTFWQEDTCNLGMLGMESHHVVATLVHDAWGDPVVLGRWRTDSPEESIPTAGFLYEGGPIEPDLVCPEGASYGDAGCTATCYWGPGTGPGCPTFASGSWQQQ